MAKYTTQIRSMVENKFDFGLKSYPIFDEKYRATLNQKIIDHYYFREIGFETVGLFKRFLNIKMNEIMPLYNRKYKLLLPDDQKNMFNNTDYQESYTKKTDTTNKANSSANGTATVSGSTTGSATSSGTSDGKTTNTQTSNSKNVFSDTPQGLLSSGDIDSDTYATTATLDEATGKNTGTATNETSDSSTSEGTSKTDSTTTNKIDSGSTGNQNEDYIRNVLGAEGGKYRYEMIYDLAERMYDIDMQIIGDLEELFFHLW